MADAEFVIHGDEEDKLKIIVSKHKIARTYGPVILYLPLDDTAIFFHYHDYIRSNIPTSSNRDVLLVNWLIKSLLQKTILGSSKHKYKAIGLTLINNYSTKELKLHIKCYSEER